MSVALGVSIAFGADPPPGFFESVTESPEQAQCASHLAEASRRRARLEP